jgi:hypothetical protein
MLGYPLICFLGSSRVLSVAPRQPEEKKEHHGALRDTIAALSRMFLYHQREIPSGYEGAEADSLKIFRICLDPVRLL